MAGCLPSYFPVLLAAVEAVTDPAFTLFGAMTTTNSTAPLLIINGPIRLDLDIKLQLWLLWPRLARQRDYRPGAEIRSAQHRGGDPRKGKQVDFCPPGEIHLGDREYEERTPGSR